VKNWRHPGSNPGTSTQKLDIHGSENGNRPTGKYQLERSIGVRRKRSKIRNANDAFFGELALAA
jgi:hypothetical protein